MNKIHQTIKSFLEKYDLLKPEITYLVAFSGGFDSMCLLDSLRKITTNKIIAIHLNHKWRGAESDNEELSCKNFCDKTGVEFYSENLPETIPHTETAAREARYKFFEKCAEKFNTNIIFTAHNKNDNAETLIYRIAMGTGISGLEGISENRGIFYRPLLEISRDEIEKYCSKNNLAPNNDSSNSDIKYKRNFIRTKIMPELTEINRNMLDAITTLIQVAKEENEIVEEYTAAVSQKISENGKLKTKKFLNLSQSLQNKIIYNIFIKHNLEYDRKKILAINEFIEENSNSKSGKTCSLTKDLWIFTSDKYIEIITAQNPTKPSSVEITKEGKYSCGEYIFELDKFDKSVKKFPQDSENIAYVNLNSHNAVFPLEIRTRQDGDYIYPLGAEGKQKIKKYLNNKKIPKHEKDNLFFLAKDKEILWAIGLGISDKIKIKDKPTHRMKFYKEGK